MNAEIKVLELLGLSEDFKTDTEFFMAHWLDDKGKNLSSTERAGLTGSVLSFLFRRHFLGLKTNVSKEIDPLLMFDTTTLLIRKRLEQELKDDQYVAN